MLSKNLLLLVFVLFLWGCTNDEPVSQQPSSTTVPGFIALGEDFDNVYQYNYSPGPTGGEIINITEENAIGKQFITIRQVAEVLTFFTFADDNFSAIQRNTTTGESRLLSDIYSLMDDRTLIWGTNSEEKFFFGYYSPRGSGDFGMRILDIDTDEFLDIPLAVNVQNVYEPLYYNGKLFVSYRDAFGKDKAAVFDTATSAQSGTLEFSGETSSFYIETAGDIAVISNLGGNGYQHTLYDFDTLEPFSQKSFILNRFFQPGPLDVELKDDKLYYLNYYAQPSSIPFGPAVYDFVREENNIIDLIGIIDGLESETGENLDLTAYRYLPEGRVFLLGYVRNFSQGLFQGGVLVISESGELLDNILTPFIPIFFLKQ